MDKYLYNGPVKEFDRVVADHWTASTYAASEKKAKSNLTYQYKKQHNRASASKITLTGPLTLEV